VPPSDVLSLEGRPGIIPMPRLPVDEPVGAPESDSPLQTPSPGRGEVESPPETPVNLDQAAAPPQSERQVRVLLVCYLIPAQVRSRGGSR
jgi:hypothetical protein